MYIQGTIKLIGEVKTFSNFQKRDVVVTTEEQYPQHILVEFQQDKTSLLDNFKVGQRVDIGINLRGREWVSPQGETKYFNSLVGWKIEGDAISTEEVPSKEQPKSLEYQDDLPF